MGGFQINNRISKSDEREKPHILKFKADHFYEGKLVLKKKKTFHKSLQKMFCFLHDNAQAFIL